MSPPLPPSPPSSIPSVDPDALARATIRKVTRRLIPFLFLLFLVCFLDRVNVGFAALEMNRDLGFSASVYGLGAGIFFLSYALFEVPSAVIMARVGARRWISRIMITWGLAASAMMFVSGPISFYTLRFLLGAAEAGFFPGMIFYLSSWFPASERARAVSRFVIAIPLATIVGGPISGALLHLNGRLGLSGWQWLFLLEGIPSVVLGFVVLRYLTDRPADATWLAPGEREWLVARLSAEEDALGDRPRASLRRALMDRTVWQLGLLYFLLVLSVYGFDLWLPQIIKAFSGLGDLWVGVLSTLPNVAAAFGMIAVAIHSDRTGERCLYVAGSGALAAVGFAASAWLLRSPVLALLALSVAAVGLRGYLGPFWTLPTMFLSREAAAAGIALINSLGNLGGFVGPSLVGVVRDTTGSFRGALLVLALAALGGGVVALQLRYASVLQPQRGVAARRTAPAAAAP
ncbi:MAG: MFS transporter [Gemmatimonadaceae bacterium]